MWHLEPNILVSYAKCWVFNLESAQVLYYISLLYRASIAEILGLGHK